MRINGSCFPMQVDVTVQRAKNTTYEYTNANGHAMMVIATFDFNITVGGGTTTAQAKSDTASPPTEVVTGLIGIQAGLINEKSSIQMSFVVEPGATYRIDTVETNGTVTLGKWFEIYF